MASNSTKSAVLSGGIVSGLFAIPILWLWQSNASLSDQVHVIESASLVQEGGETPLQLVRTPHNAAFSPSHILATARHHEEISADKRTKLLASLSSSDRDAEKELQRVLLVQWADENGHNAAEWLKEQFKSGRGADEIRHALKDVLATWAHHDTSAAVAWYEANMDLLDKPFGFDVLRCLAPYDLGAVPRLMGPSFRNVYDSSFSEDLAMPNHSTEELARAMDALAKADPSWGGPSIHKALAEKWIPMDPDGAKRWAMDQPPGKFREVVLKEHLKYRLRNAEDTMAAADALLSEQDNLEPEFLLDSIAELWPVEDLNGVGVWLGTQKLDQNAWKAVATFASRAVNQDPVSAFAWLDAIADESHRERAYGDVFDQWHAKNRHDAENFLREHLNEWPEPRVRLLQELIVSQHHDPNGW